jgi:hypothetical protein
VSVLAGARELLLLTRAERTARAYAPAQAETVRALASAAKKRRKGAIAVWSRWRQPAAASLAREALELYLRAACVAEDASASAEGADVAAAFTRVANERADASDQDRDALRLAETALVAKDPLFFDGLEPRALAATRAALELAARLVASRVEPRSVKSIRFARWGRFAALLLVALYAVFAVLRATLVPKNIAYGKKVTVSSTHPAVKIDPSVFLDGRGSRAFAFHTNNEDRPWVVVDLQSSYSLERVVVHNRGDGWMDANIPLALELSEDGATYAEVARQTELFETGHPWVISLDGQRARYVRLRVMRHSSIALAAIEIYGSP